MGWFWPMGRLERWRGGPEAAQLSWGHKGERCAPNCVAGAREVRT